MAQKTHSELSPSSAERWMNCPGSIALCRTVPKLPQSEYAAEGEAAHSLLERCNKDPNLSVFDFVGTDIDGIPVTEEMAEAVSFALDYIRTEQQKNGGWLMVEKKVDIIPGKIGGTIDAALATAYDTVTVFDFKYGKGVLVAAVDNPQLLLYAYPLVQKYDPKMVKLVVIQPRTENQVSVWELPAEHFDVFMPEVERKIALTEEKNALTAPGDWCKFCAAKVVCPSLRKDLSNSLSVVQNRGVIFPDVKTLTPEIVARVMDYKDRIEDWLSAVCVYAQSVLEGGGSIPGYELGKKRANRRWKDEKATLEAFEDLGDAIIKTSLISPAQMEKLVGKERKKQINELTEIPDNGFTVKKISL